MLPQGASVSQGRLYGIKVSTMSRNLSVFVTES